MKKILTLLFVAFAICGNVVGQQKSRLIAVQNRQYIDGTGLSRTDSASVIYNDSNKIMSAQDYLQLETQANCDTLIVYGFLSDTVYKQAEESFTYNAQGRLTGRVTRSAATHDSPLFNITKRSYDYDSLGNMVKNTTEIWDNNAWQNRQQLIHVYNNGNLEKETLKFWENNAWADLNESQNTFVNGLKTESVYTAWNPANGDVVNRGKGLYEYDSNGQLIKLTSQLYNKVRNEYINNNRVVHTLNAKGEIVRIAREVWHPGTSVWGNDNQIVNLYTATGKPLSIIVEMWNGVDKTWTPFQMYDFVYDANDNDSDVVMQMWNTDSARYINEERTMYEYNSFNQQTRYQTMRWSYDTEQWTTDLGDLDNTYYYEVHTPPVNINASKAIKTAMLLYPVPASDVLNVDAKLQTGNEFYVTITDIQGQLMRSWKENATTHYKKQIPLNGMANGNYFITINSGAESISKQFTILR